MWAESWVGLGWLELDLLARGGFGALGVARLDLSGDPRGGSPNITLYVINWRLVYVILHYIPGLIHEPLNHAHGGSRPDPVLMAMPSSVIRSSFLCSGGPTTISSSTTLSSFTLKCSSPLCPPPLLPSLLCSVKSKDGWVHCPFIFGAKTIENFDGPLRLAGSLVELFQSCWEQWRCPFRGGWYVLYAHLLLEFVVIPPVSPNNHFIVPTVSDSTEFKFVAFQLIFPFGFGGRWVTLWNLLLRIAQSSFSGCCLSGRIL